MKIIVTFAVQVEFAPWRRMRGFKRIGNDAVFVTRTRDAEIYALITGVRANDFQSRFGRFLSGADACVISGLAGSLKEQYPVGNIFVAKNIKGGTTKDIMASDHHLVQTAVECGATPVEALYTSDRVVTSAAEKAHLAAMADAVDMETFHITAATGQNGVPAVAIRAISDAADQNLPLDFNQAIRPDGTINWRPALMQVAASPASVPRMVKFGLESSRAARGLALFLDRYLECLTAKADLPLVPASMEAR